MKLNSKGLILILILLSASHVTFTKEISSLSRRIKFRKSNSKRFYNSKVFSTNKKSQTSNKQYIESDWSSTDYLLPIAFLKGLLSQFDSTEKIAKYLEYLLLDYRDIPVKIICEKAIKKIFGEKEKDTPDNEFIDQAVGDMDFKDIFSINTILGLFQSSSNQNEAIINIGNLCHYELRFYNDGIDSIISHIDILLYKEDYKNKNNFELSGHYINWFKFSTFYKYDLSIISEFEKINEIIPSLSDEIIDELKFVHLTCLKQSAIDKILEANIKIYNLTNGITDTIFYKFTELMDVNKFNIELTTTQNIRDHVDLEDPLMIKECYTSVKKYYSDKKKDVELMKKTPQKCTSDQYDINNIISILLKFTYKFIKKTIICIKDSFLAEISTFVISKLVKIILAVITGWSAFKFIWYLGKFTFYLIYALNMNAFNKGLKRERAEKFGISLGSLWNAIKSYLSMGIIDSKKRFKKMRKHKLNK